MDNSQQESGRSVHSFIGKLLEVFKKFITKAMPEDPVRVWVLGWLSGVCPALVQVLTILEVLQL